jgi:hypothetical protein
MNGWKEFTLDKKSPLRQMIMQQIKDRIARISGINETATNDNSTTQQLSEPVKPKDLRQNLFPVKDFQGSCKSWKNSGGAYVIYSKNVKRISLQRVLVSQLVFEKEQFILRDLLVIYDNMLILQDMATVDEGFRRKFGKSLEDLAMILKNSRLTSSPTKAGLKLLSQKLTSLEGFLIPNRNLKQTSMHFKGKYEVRQGIKLGVLTTTIPAKRFIGIGYRDKGTARDLALNGEPSWQEYCRMRLWDNLK